jgi:hypothetical protein
MASLLQMLDKSHVDDLRHDLVGVVDSLAAGVAQRERESGGEVFWRAGVSLSAGSCMGRRGSVSV